MTAGAPAADLSFDTHLPSYATHALHPFAAKFPPQLARWMVEEFSRPGETVLDPFAGSGTMLVEARLLGRNALAADIDPLARLIARVK
ncbi:MAG TPA: DNA methyltransferase, partial [Dehalococcoidia bacterium]|nr:DNA methyltransferase [Dehalococcoidia bacterium]